MIYIPRTTSAVKIEKYTRIALPPAPSYTGNTFIIEFQYKKSNNNGSIQPTEVHTAQFVKHIYFDKKYSKLMWKWGYQGISK